MLGILVIVPMWASILACIIFFRKINIWAALLMIPYLLWVSFATVLNATIWYLNP
jgi:tryptophan-rich sensory protein